MAYRFRIAAITPYSFRFALRLRVSGIVGSKFEENIAETEADAFREIKSGQPFSTILAAIALRMSLPSAGGFTTVAPIRALHRRRFNLHTAAARNLREPHAQRLLGCLDFHANTHPPFSCEVDFAAYRRLQFYLC